MQIRSMRMIQMSKRVLMNASVSLQQLEPRRFMSVNGSSVPVSFVEVGDVTYFLASDAVHGQQLWQTDGTAATTQPAAAPLPAGGMSILDSIPDEPMIISVSQNGIWASDGTVGGTVKISNTGVSRDKITRVGDSIYFVIQHASSSGGIFKANVSGGGAVQVQSYDDAYMFGSIGNKLLYMGGDQNLGYHLYATDGTSVTQLDQRVYTYYDAQHMQSATLGGIAYFTTTGNGYGLWKTDGTASGTIKVDTPSPVRIQTLGSKLIFTTSSNDQTGEAVWVSDGTAVGRVKLLDHLARDLSVVAGRAFFSVTNGDQYDLWTSDGTVGGTHLVATALSAIPVELDGSFYFFRHTGSAYQLYKTDSTASSASLVIDLGNTTIFSLAAADHRLYFAAEDATHGREPWVSDGTAGGTMLLKDINQQPIAPPTSVRLDSDPGLRSDNVTNDSTPGFYVSYNTDAKKIAWFVDGVEVLRAPGNNLVVTGGLSDGTHTITAAAVASDNSLSAMSDPLVITIDTDPPVATPLTFSNTSQNAVELKLKLSEQIVDGTSTVVRDIGFFSLTNIDTGDVLAINSSGYDFSYDSNTKIATCVLSGVAQRPLPKGRYEVAFGSTEVTDVAGNALGTIKFTFQTNGTPTSAGVLYLDSGIDSVLKNGVLNIIGSSGNDVIVAQLTSNPKKFSFTANGQSIGTFAATDVKQIVLHGKAGDDTIHLDGIAIPSNIYGDDGNDVIYGTATADRIMGGNGNDWINAGAGNDVIYGDAGNDKLFGGDGNDYINGGAGTDVIRSGAGRDRIIATIGVDDLRDNAGDLISNVV